MKAHKLRHMGLVAAHTLPSIVMITCFTMIPIVLSVAMGFFYVSAVDRPWKFIGFEFYNSAFTDDVFYKSLLNTLLFGGCAVLINFVFGLFLSLVLAHHRRLNLYRYIFYIPAVVSSVAMGILWSQILLPTKDGLLNSLLMSLGMREPINWLGESSNARTVIVMLNFVGAGGGMTLVLFTNAIRNIPSEIVESAVLEGASSAQVAFRISLPMISSTLSAWVILNIIGGMKIFENIYALTGGGPGNDTYTLAIYIYEARNSVFGLGYAAALGVIMTLIIVLLTVVYLVLSKYNKSEGVEM